MIDLQAIYWLAGLYFGWLAVSGWRDSGNSRRLTTGLFWALVSLALLVGERLPPIAMGALVVMLAVIAGFGGLRRGRYEESAQDEKQAEAVRLGNRLFLPALAIPAVTLLIAAAGKELQIGGTRVFGAEQTTLIALGVACAAALAAACVLTRRTPASAVEQSRRLLDAIGWAALLPLMLAALGAVFAAAGVGDAVAALVAQAIPTGNRFAVVAAYALGMALFTMIMGNAFAAFPVITAGIGLPLLVHAHGADAGPMAAIGMLSGYCGTLLTPMAANFNLVPAALLELRDPHAVIRAQAGTALPLLACNIVLMYLVVFR